MGGQLIAKKRSFCWALELFILTSHYSHLCCLDATSQISASAALIHDLGLILRVHYVFLTSCFISCKVSQSCHIASVYRVEVNFLQQDLIYGQ